MSDKSDQSSNVTPSQNEEEEEQADVKMVVQKVDADEGSSLDFESEGNDDDEDDDEIPVSKEFEEAVIKYSMYDDLIRKKMEEVSELKSKRNPLEQKILEYLDGIGETTIEIDGGKLRKNKFETKQPLTTDMIRESISEKVQNPETANEIMKTMDGKRPMKTRTALKRTFERAKKKKGGAKKKGSS